jgi:hypothetical protein
LTQSFVNSAIDSFGTTTPLSTLHVNGDFTSLGPSAIRDTSFATIIFHQNSKITRTTGPYAVAGNFSMVTLQLPPRLEIMGD